MNEANEHTDDITIEEEAMEQEVRPKLKMGHMIPDFKLATVDGKMVSPMDYKEKMNLVILFFNPRESCDWEMLATVKQRYHEIADQNAEVLGIAGGPMDELKDCVAALELPFPLLHDVDMQVASSYNIAESTALVADKFGELEFHGPVCGNVDETLDEVVSVLDAVELECPECGVSSWPAFQE